MELEATICPEATGYIWQWFCEIDATRSGTGYGANPIALRDLEAWCRLRKVVLTDFELDCLLALDRVRIVAMAKK